MTAAARRVAHLLADARPGDPVAAAARSIRDHLARAGWPGPVLALRTHPGVRDVEALDTDDLAGRTVVLHTVDGGEALEPIACRLAGTEVHLVHHGSAPGARRGVLRALRGAARVALAASPGGREELRALGFADVRALPVHAARAGLSGIDPDTATAADLRAHPGPRIVAVGPVAPGRSLELLVDAFADLVTAERPSATLSICGPGTRWYEAMLQRRILNRGLRACELIEPADDAATLARLDGAAAVVTLVPAPLDPYAVRAVAGGAALVAPATAATAWARATAPARVVGLPAAPGRAQLTDALAAATAHTAVPTGPGALRQGPDATVGLELRRVLALA